MIEKCGIRILGQDTGSIGGKMPFVVLVLYIIAAGICGMLGKRTAFGFLGHFILALIITPIGDFLVQIVARPSREMRRRMKEYDIE
jgi:type IV secretory pathway VirB2 component (pilin)